MDKFNYLGSADPETIEALYRQYLNDPSSVEESWKKFFEGFEFARTFYKGPAQTPEVFDKEFKVVRLIEAYRRRGHLFTETNPVRTRRQYSPTLDLENYGLGEKDLDTIFQAGSNIGIGAAPLRVIVDHMKQTYCRSIGTEYLFIRNPRMVEWLQTRMESNRNIPHFHPEEKKHIYTLLKQAVGFEHFIHRKFVGQKRFSLEGAESLIPAMDAVIERGSHLGAEEFVVGMAHRGRLNVLANILRKPVEDIFTEFMGTAYREDIALGDVKYHLGYSNTCTTGTGKSVKLNLVPNPSHLEAVDPVVQGIARARTEKEYGGDFNRLVPILIHGDAAIASQGVVYEVIQMSQLAGYKTGGTIHLVINNQVGFTTNYLDARSSTYCTDIGKVIKSPIFHVNGDDVEALVHTIRLAMNFRQEFHTDVFIDILCYRKYGHNEGDEPRFTQPLLYRAIEKHPNPRDIYSKKLTEEGIYTDEDIAKEEKTYTEWLDRKYEEARQDTTVHIQPFLGEIWKGFEHPGNSNLLYSSSTGVEKKKLQEIADRINRLPEEGKFLRKLEKLVTERKKMIAENRLDWAMGELLAYGTLLEEGHPVRISGQDSVRGTFAHRHAAFHITDTTEVYYPLKNISGRQARFDIFNSPLSEYGVMGFEYGYALAMPEGLTVWEAQYGDFFNAAQVIVDQYISSAEEKWGLMNGLVLYLPHGYEGQGPEHSSARIERFLSLSARNNMQIVNCTTPANFFHALRNHIKRNIRIPLVIFTPKSLLRHPRCTSPLDEFTGGRFRELIDDPDTDPENVTRVVFCSGKIYYDLLARKEKLHARDIALVRLEQLYPLPFEQIEKLLDRYPNAMLHLWVQEEPENMGAWRYLRGLFPRVSLVPVARIASGSPATGLSGLHQIGQDEIIGKVFRKCTCELKNDYCALQCVEGKSRKEILKVHQYFDSESRFSI
ncbi:MAG: 2-oxoglutarate dehydrogenase E1 component [Bacteroidales bacterium]